MRLLAVMFLAIGVLLSQSPPAAAHNVVATVRLVTTPDKPITGQSMKLQVTPEDYYGNPIPTKAVSASAENGNQQLALAGFASSPQGVISGEATFPSAGTWLVRIHMVFPDGERSDAVLTYPVVDPPKPPERPASPPPTKAPADRG